jgi:hypothetical protein
LLALPEMAVNGGMGSDASGTRTGAGTAGPDPHLGSGSNPMTALPAAITALAIAAAITRRRRRARPSQNGDAIQAVPAMVEVEQQGPTGTDGINDDQAQLPSSPADLVELPDPNSATAGEHPLTAPTAGSLSLSRTHLGRLMGRKPLGRAMVLSVSDRPCNRALPGAGRPGTGGHDGPGPGQPCPLLADDRQGVQSIITRRGWIHPRAAVRGAPSGGGPKR